MVATIALSPSTRLSTFGFPAPVISNASNAPGTPPISPVHPYLFTAKEFEVKTKIIKSK